MGDRAQIKIREGTEEVTLYTHWGASAAIDDIRAALIRAQQHKRLDDAPYLARIIFCQLVPPEDQYGTTGYGIWTGEIDGKELVIDVKNQTIESQDYGITRQTINDFIYNTYEGEDDDDAEESDEE